MPLGGWLGLGLGLAATEMEETEMGVVASSNFCGVAGGAGRRVGWAVGAAAGAGAAKGLGWSP